MFELRAIDGDTPETPVDYDPMKVRNDCRNSLIYCIISILLLVAAFELTNQDVMNALPGGPFTAMILGFAIIIAVLVLCYIQRPRR